MIFFIGEHYGGLMRFLFFFTKFTYSCLIYTIARYMVFSYDLFHYSAQKATGNSVKCLTWPNAALGQNLYFS